MDKNKNLKTHIVIAAGGTGGHIYPGLAVAKELINRGYSVSWIGSEVGLEKKILSHLEDINKNINLELDLLDISGVRNKGLKGWMNLPFKLMKAVWQARKILKKRQAELVISFGGFASGPAGLAIKLLGKKLFIHEQNAVLGLTNQYLSPWADQIFTAFEIKNFKNKKINLIGNPVRQEILDLRERDFTPPLCPTGQGPVGLSLPQGGRRNQIDRSFRILITGGSQGSEVFNKLIPEALFKITEHLAIHHQAGEKTIKIAEQSYQEKMAQGLRQNIQHDVKLVSYFPEIAKEYAWADLVICRAGALSVYELALAGIPAIFIPHPGVVDDHQRKNAEWLSLKNINLCLIQADLNAEKLASEIKKLINHPEILKTWKEKVYLETDNKKEAVRLLCDQVDLLLFKPLSH